MSFSASETVLHDIPVLQLFGEIDLTTAEAMRAHVGEVLRRGSALTIIDLSQVTFFDSAGLKVLDEAQSAALASGSRLALAAPSGRVVRLLEITGMQDRFPIHPSAEQATGPTQ